jgi:ATP adenylyltransferase
MSSAEKWTVEMQASTIDCIFCETDPSRIIAANDLAYVVRDSYPVSPGHSLIIPKRHVVDYFGLTAPEVLAINSLIKDLKAVLGLEDPQIDGFNIGMNAGESAGQTIFHCHVHLIPRRSGDVDNPRGGVRHTIPGKGFY